MSTQGKLHSFFTKWIWVKGQKRYIVTTLVFLAWMIFFDRYTLNKTMSLDETIETLQHSKEKYHKDIKLAERDKRELEENSERFAREKFLMHKEDEDVFLIDNK